MCFIFNTFASDIYQVHTEPIPSYSTLLSFLKPNYLHVFIILHRGTISRKFSQYVVFLANCVCLPFSLLPVSTQSASFPTFNGIH